MLLDRRGGVPLWLVVAVVLGLRTIVALQGFHLSQLAPRDRAALGWQLVGSDDARWLRPTVFGHNSSFADPLAAGSFGAQPRKRGFRCSLADRELCR